MAVSWTIEEERGEAAMALTDNAAIEADMEVTEAATTEGIIEAMIGAVTKEMTDKARGRNIRSRKTRDGIIEC